MITILLSTLLISGIAAALAAALVVVDRLVNRYGPCEIDINNGKKKLTVNGGGSLLEALGAENIFIPSACGGRGSCGYCKLKVLDGAGPLLPTEEPYLTPAERSEGVRLSCQVKVRRNLRIQIPEQLFSIRAYRLRCTEIVDLTHDIKQVRLALEEPAAIAFRPGQYMQLQNPAYEDRESVYRAYSISSDPADANTLEFVIRLVPGGIFTTWCFKHLKVGDTVSANGPYGEFGLSATDSPILFIAGGSGMAPIKCILHHMKNTAVQRPATYFFGANLVKELFYLDRMAQFEKEVPHFKFVPVVARPEPDSGWKGDAGLVTQALDRHVPDTSQHEAYLCGSPGMIDATIKVLVAKGMPQSRIYYDKFG